MTKVDLLQRIEAASGADRAIDKALFAALVDPRTEKNYWGWQGSRPQGSPAKPATDYWDLRQTPEVTASIDAALALVERLLPGWFWRGGHVPSFHWTGSRNVDCWAHLSRTDASNCDKGDESTGWCDSVPLAILAALLKALIENDR